MISVFTPSHNPQYLDDALYSLLSQTYADWEWVVLLNSGAKWKPDNDDERIKIYYEKNESGCVGFYKKAAVALCQGDILVELDHDDWLARNALEKIYRAFDNRPDVGFVYSDTYHVLGDGSQDPNLYRADYGWTYSQKNGLTFPNSFGPHPHNVNHIWYAPNHVRAFRRQVYTLAGGYNPDMKVLDDQDLMARLYILSDFLKIDEPIYYQRSHATNTQKEAETNAFIQVETLNLYDKYIMQSALAWSARKGLYSLDLGAHHNKPEGFLGVDLRPGPGVDIAGDFLEIDLPDNSCGVIRAYDFLEHIPDKLAVIKQIYRLLCDGGILLSMTPSTDGRGAFQDPTHVAFYNENSFWYYTDRQYGQFIDNPVRFQSSSLKTFFPSEWHRLNNIPYVQANLIAIKGDEHEFGGPLNV